MAAIPELGNQLRFFRKQRYPLDTQASFGVRIGVSKGTVARMEKGDLSVSMIYYFEAAKLFGVDDSFARLFEQPKQGLLESLNL